MKPKRIEVEWLDSGAVSAARWSTHDEVKRAGMHQLRCSTVGYLVAETSDTITVAQSVNWPGDDDAPPEYGHAFTIPRVSMTSPVRELRR